MKRSKLVLLIVLALGAVALIAWLASHLERVHESRYVGPTAAARSDRFLACKRLFTELGVPSSQHVNVGALPPRDVCAFVWATGNRESEHVAQRLLEWVNDGGHLVVFLPSGVDRRVPLKHDIVKGRFEYPLARELGVEFATDYVIPRLEDAADLVLPKPSADSDLPIVVLHGEPLEVELDTHVWVKATDDDGSEEREYVARREHGEGLVTFVTSDDWMTNGSIGDHDHARFAWELANLGGGAREVWFMTSERQPGLFAWIAHQGWMVLASGLAFLALWLWKSSARFGPVLADPPREHRDFAEHIRATAAFLWRRREAAVLLAAPRAELAQRLALMRPDLAGAAPAVLAGELARVSGLDARSVSEALEAQRPTEPATFQRIVSNLVRLRSSL